MNEFLAPACLMTVPSRRRTWPRPPSEILAFNGDEKFLQGLHRFLTARKAMDLRLCVRSHQTVPRHTAWLPLVCDIICSS